jgi:hypothetical protein
VKRRWALFRLTVSGLFHGQYGLGTAWRVWRDADWTPEKDLP